MKTYRLILTYLASVLLLASPRHAPAADGITETLQKGVFEEEANHNLDAAITAYQAVVSQFDEQRKVAATAIFRLAECYRKQGKTNEATAQYQRVLRDFADQTELARLSRNLVPPTVAAKATGGDSAADKQLRAEIQRRVNRLTSRLTDVEQDLARAKEELAAANKEGTELVLVRTQVGTAPSPVALPIQIDDSSFLGWKNEYERLLGAKDDSGVNRLKDLHERMNRWIQEIYLPRQEAAIELARTRIRGLREKSEELQKQKEAIQTQIDDVLDKMPLTVASTEAGPGSKNPSANVQRQRELLEEEIRLVEKQLQTVQKMAEVGRANSDDLIRFQREILTLKRQLLALERPEQQVGEVTTITGGLLAAAGSPAPGVDPKSESAATASNEETKELQRIKALIEDSPDLINAHDPNGNTPLHRAAEKGHLAIAEFLLANLADVNRKNQNNNSSTPLHRATAVGHKTMIELLLKHGADLNARDWNGTALHIAAEKGYRTIVELLLNKGAEVNAKAGSISNPPSEVHSDCTSLHVAAGRGYKAIVDLLLTKGASVEAVTSRGATPLWLAVRGNQFAVAERLLAQQANPNRADQDGVTPLRLAAQGANEPMIKLLLSHDAQINFKSADGRTALIDAVLGDKPAIVELLVNNKADVNLGQAKGVSPLHLAIEKRSLALTELLLKNKADVNRLSGVIFPPLRVALQLGSRDLVELLLAYNANPNLKDEEGFTPFLYSIFAAENTVFAELLIDHKADVNSRAPQGYTALHWAAANDKRHLAEVLVAHGAELNAQDESGSTPLHCAVAAQRKEMVEWLLGQKADLNIANKAGLTPVNLVGTLQRVSFNLMWGIPDFSHARPVQRGAFILGQPLISIRELLLKNGAKEDAKPEAKKPDGAAVLGGKAMFYGQVRGEVELQADKAITVADALRTLTYDDFADLKKVTIYRRNPGADQSTAIPVDVSAILKGDRSKDLPLQDGDRVHVPEKKL